MDRNNTTLFSAANESCQADVIPLEEITQTMGPNDDGMLTHIFYAFNTIVTLQAYAEALTCHNAFNEARLACRTFERHFSRTLPHSDITRINTARGKAVAIDDITAKLLKEALRYCKNSQGHFDITVGPLMQLWNFHDGVIPQADRLNTALSHVNWRALHVWEDRDCAQAFAQLDDPKAALDIGGIAKGWIADALADKLIERGIESFIINLGGNVVAHGQKPHREPWHIGLQDPRSKENVVGAVPLYNASAVTSGVYERCFDRKGIHYHHILNPRNGYPAKTDAAGVTVIAHRSLDAEGYSTTLLALGIAEGISLARNIGAIRAAHFIDFEGKLYSTDL